MAAGAETEEDHHCRTGISDHGGHAVPHQDHGGATTDYLEPLRDPEYWDIVE